jgi:hypothetical protein
MLKVSLKKHSQMQQKEEHGFAQKVFCLEQQELLEAPTKIREKDIV